MPLEDTLGKLNIRERLEAIEDIFYNSINISELEEVYAYLLGLLKKNVRENGLFLSDRNAKLATELLYNTRVKGLILQYFTKGYVSEDGEQLLAYLRAKTPNAIENKFFNTYVRFVGLTGFIERLIKGMEEVCVLLDQVQDLEGNVITLEIKQLQAVISSIKAVEARLLADPFNANEVLGENVQLFNLKTRISKDIEIEVSRLLNAVDSRQKVENERVLKGISVPFDDVYTSGNCEFFPVLPLRKETRARCIFLCSPFEKEIYLYVKSFMEENKRNFVVLSPKYFNGKNADTIRAVFKFLEEQGKDCLITDINEYRNSENKEILLRELLDFSKNGRYVFVVDSLGTRKFYQQAFDIAKMDAGRSIMDVSYVYLTMPAYSDTIALFEEKGMITSADYAEVKQKMPFMGFCGLNDAVAVFAKGGDWKRTAERWSLENKPIAIEYLANQPLQVNLIDSGWGDYTNATLTVDEKKRDFDYDDLAGVNTANLRKIVDGPYNLFEKCGCVAAYCLLAGADSSIWKTLDADAQSERLTLATRLVMRLLDVDIEPEVKVVPTNEWTLKGAGGVCCDGGKRIEYKQDCITDYDWMVGTVVHECFHAFQHKAQREWKRWYFDELGITKGRVNEWSFNFGYDAQAKKNRYCTIEKNKTAYMTQIVESDARAFEIDCANARAQIFSTIDFD